MFGVCFTLYSRQSRNVFSCGVGRSAPPHSSWDSDSTCSVWVLFCTSVLHHYHLMHSIAQRATQAWLLVLWNRDLNASEMWNMKSLTMLLCWGNLSPFPEIWETGLWWTLLLILCLIVIRTHTELSTAARIRSGELWGHEDLKWAEWGLWISRCASISMSCAQLSDVYSCLWCYSSLPHLLSHLLVFGISTQSGTTSQMVT